MAFELTDAFMKEGEIFSHEDRDFKGSWEFHKNVPPGLMAAGIIALEQMASAVGMLSQLAGAAWAGEIVVSVGNQITITGKVTAHSAAVRQMVHATIQRLFSHAKPRPIHSDFYPYSIRIAQTGKVVKKMNIVPMPEGPQRAN